MRVSYIYICQHQNKSCMDMTVNKHIMRTFTGTMSYVAIVCVQCPDYVSKDSRPYSRKDFNVTI